MYKKTAHEEIQRVTVNLPKDLLHHTRALTGGTITETLIEGLRWVERRRAHQKGMALKGKLRLRVDIDNSRERPRR